MGNIHLNPRPRSESELLWLILSANTQHHQFSLIIYMYMYEHMNNNISYCDGNKWRFEKKCGVNLTDITATSLRIMGNIHPNQKTIRILCSITSAKIHDYHLRLIIYMQKQINNILSYCDDQKAAIWDKYVVNLTEITATSFRIMGNTHPNPNHLFESLHVMAHYKHHECRPSTFINRTPLQRNNYYY